MSVRAYQITTMEYEDESTFNLWNDTDLVRVLAPYMPDGFNPLDGGFLEFYVEDLKKALEKAFGETRTILQEMVHQAEKSETGWVQYICF